MPLKSCLSALAVLTLCACSGSSPTEPSRASGPLTGTWTGRLERAGAAQAMQLDLTDEPFGSGYIVNGRYTASDDTGTSTGILGGIVINGEVNLTLKPFNPPVCGTLPFVVPAGDVVLSLTVTGRQMSGSAVVVQCAGALTGTATFTR
jgi:hypothetical protein